MLRNDLDLYENETEQNQTFEKELSISILWTGFQMSKSLTNTMLNRLIHKDKCTLYLYVIWCDSFVRFVFLYFTFSFSFSIQRINGCKGKLLVWWGNNIKQKYQLMFRFLFDTTNDMSCYKLYRNERKNKKGKASHVIDIWYLCHFCFFDIFFYIDRI